MRVADKLPPSLTPVTRMGSVRTNRVASRAQWQLIPILLAIWAAPIWAQEGQQDAVRGQVANPHGHLTLACEGCHTTTAWRPVRKVMEFDHNTQTSYALRGLHQNVPCTGCHVDLVFSKAPTQCSECHADLHRRQFGANCQQCHSVQGWNVQVSAIQDHNNRFPLLGAHAAVICDECHRGAASGVFTGLNTQCVSCHQKDFQTATPLNHVAAGLPTTCEACHGMNSWQQGTRFDHAQFAHFALTGAHASLQCQQCHVGNRFAGTPAACVGCHMNDYMTAKTPDHVAGNFSQDCAGCHTTTTWLSAKFDHNTTGFALTGAHNSLQCTQCHNAQFGNYNIPSGACANCHMADYNGTTNPPHQTSGFPLTCDGCHTTTNWMAAGGGTWVHPSTPFALTGYHATMLTNNQCAQCHVNNNYNLTVGNPVCWGCHQSDYNGTNNPPHATSGFAQDCSICHSTTDWSGATFIHPTTPFTLTGYHATMLTNNQCAQCHVNNNYNLTVGNPVCWGCHQSDYNGTNNPPHATSGFAQDCSMCHSTTDWSGATFTHPSTPFALTGYHATMLTSNQCAQCHVNNNYNLTVGNPACWSCHQTDYNGTNNPPHAASGFAHDCSICHSTTDWSGATFTHPSTPFALTGYHATMLTSNQCAQCHVNNNYNLTVGNPVCWGCHQSDYNTLATNPNHSAAQFPQDCSMCHSTIDWSGATFTHPSSPLALTGYHGNMLANNQCTACHTGTTPYAATPSDCWSCHQNDYNNLATNPPHAAQGFPHDCSGCHTFVDWSGATFNHASTGFALTGAHTTQACTACHNATNGNYNLTAAQTACWTCHQADYNGTTNPPHATAGFPQDCSQCHSTAATTPPWAGATFTHPSTPLALTGYHATMLANNQCSSCHVGGGAAAYTNTTTVCYNCHTADWNGTSNPGHAAAHSVQPTAFPQTCDSCHTFIDWTGAKFTQHDTITPGFRIYSGQHNGRWQNCTDCHVNSSDYTNGPSLTCMSGTCHPQASTNAIPAHINSTGYAYSAPLCYKCHSGV
jgi:hypothetical protein